MNISAERLREILYDAFLQGFLTEHDPFWKSASRYPLAGDFPREALRAEFEAWLAQTPKLGDREAGEMAAR